MSDVLHIDFETRSVCDLKKAGAHAYALHPTTEIMCMAWAIGGGPVQLWHPGLTFPDPVRHHVATHQPVSAHNASFELAIWNIIGRRDHGWPKLDPATVSDTMAEATYHNMPAGLEGACKAAGMQAEKDMAGNALMRQLSRPEAMDEGVPVWDEDPDKRERLFAYARQDVEVQRGLSRRLARLPAKEQAVWRHDVAVNNRGLALDLPTINKLSVLADEARGTLDARMGLLTGGEVTAATQVQGLARWVQAQGVPMDSLGKADITDILVDGTISPRVREVLECRLEAAKGSAAKLEAMREGVCPDGRIRGLLQYYGASMTGRWAGRRVQPQNLPRPNRKLPEVLAFIDDVNRADITTVLGRMQLADTHGPLLAAIADTLRSLFIAPPGYEFICADFAAIEARVLAWLAGQNDVLDVFRSGQDIYLHAAEAIYGYPVNKEDHPEERQIGKVSVLACGYQGGVNAFQAMAKLYGLKISNAKARKIVKAWRAGNSSTVSWWHALNDAALSAATDTTGARYAAGPVEFARKGSFLTCRLPSGRLLCYPYPTVRPVTRTIDVFDEVVHPDGRVEEICEQKEITYDAVHYRSVEKGVWGTSQTYGGKLAENITQAVSRDLLAEAMLRLEANGYPIVLHVHDEAVAEVREGTGDLEEFQRIMAETPAWAAGLPVSAAGWRGDRYRKD